MPLFNGTTPISSIWYNASDEYIYNRLRLIRSVYNGNQIVFPDAIHDYQNYNMSQEWSLYLPSYGRSVYQEREVNTPIFGRSVTSNDVVSAFFPGGQFRGLQVKNNGDYVTSYQTNLRTSAGIGFQYQLKNIIYRANGNYELFEGGIWTNEGGTTGVDNTFHKYLYIDDIVGWAWYTRLDSAVFDLTSFGICRVG